MPAPRAPGALISFVDLPPPRVAARVDVPAFVCVTERGPLNTPTRCGSWATFERIFGGFVPTGLGAYAVKAFFDNGGLVAWVVRVAAPERVSATTGPQPADRTRSVVASLEGMMPGAAVTVTDAGHSHTYGVVGVDATSGSVTWDRPLHPDFAALAGLTLATGAGHAVAEATDDAALPVLRLRAASPGAWGDRVQVAISPGRSVTAASRPDLVGSATATPVDGTAGFVVGDRCAVSQDLGGVASTATATLAGVDAARRVLQWDPPLPAVLDPALPLRIETLRFSLGVLMGGRAAEVWPDLSTASTHPRFAPAVLAGSDLLRVEVLAPDEPAPALVRLRGGRDGVAALRIADLTGDELAGDVLTGDAVPAPVGVAALHTIDEPAAVAMPDLVAPASPVRVTRPEPVDPCDPCTPLDGPSPDPLEAVVTEGRTGFGLDDIVAGQQTLIDSCAANGERLALLDPPPQCRSAGELLQWVARFSSSYAMTIAPWTVVIEPSDPAARRGVPSSAHLAGLIAAGDHHTGPWLSPANRTLTWAHGLDLALTDAEHALANDAGLNLIRALPGRGLVPMGSRTLSPDPLWRFVATRRTMIWLRRALRHHLAWVVYEPISTGLATLLTTTIATLLTDLWDAGALVGDTAQDAFVVEVDVGAAATGRLLMVIGVALARPSEFVTVRVSRTDNRLELDEGPALVLQGAS